MASYAKGYIFSCPEFKEENFWKNSAGVLIRGGIAIVTVCHVYYVGLFMSTLYCLTVALVRRCHYYQ